MSSSHWQGKNVVVSGGSQGLGWHFCNLVYLSGANVWMVARDADRLKNAIAEIAEDSVKLGPDSGRSESGSIHAVSADVLTSEGVTRIREAVSEFGGVDLLINAVGKSDRGKLLDLSPEDLTQIWKINVLSTFSLTSALLPQLREKSGTVVNIGSLASKLAPRFLGGYAVAKFSLAALSQQLRLELAEEGVHVMLVCPGPIRRADGAARYKHLTQNRNLPESATAPGGGAKVKGLDPAKLAQQILDAATVKKSEIIIPFKTRILILAAAFSPRLGDWLLKRFTS